MAKWRDRNRYQKLMGKYKVTCDRSGFTVYNTDIVSDYRGRKVTPNNADPIDPREQGVVYSQYPNPQIQRPNQVFYSVTPPDPDGLNWEDVDMNWELLDVNWEDV